MALTEKQKRFAFEYVQDFNATKAAIRASYSEAGAYSSGSRLLENVEILAEIEELKAMHARVARLSKEWILDQWMHIAAADPSDLVKVKVIPCTQCWPENMRELLSDPNPLCALCAGGGVRQVHVADTSKLKGSARWLYAGAVQKKDGIEIKMADQAEARKNLANYLGMINKTEISGPGGGPVQLQAVKPAAEYSDEELALMMSQQAQLGVGMGVLTLEASTNPTQS